MDLRRGSEANRAGGSSTRARRDRYPAVNAIAVDTIAVDTVAVDTVAVGTMP